MGTTRRVLAAGGVAGPAAFIAAWALLGARARGYSPVSDAISELAAVDAPSRVGMTAGLVALGAGVTAYSAALREEPGPAWGAAAVTGLAALAVAATPLTPPGPDAAHGAFAAVGYAALAATPLLAAAPRAGGDRRGWRAWSVACGAVAAACLAATALGEARGLLQRLGLTAGHVWIITSAWGLVRRPPPAVVDRERTP